MRIAYFFVSILLFFNLFACQSVQAPTPSEGGSNSPTPETVAETQAAGLEPEVQIKIPSSDFEDSTNTATKYSFLATLDYNKHSLQVEQTIRYTN